MVRYLLPQGSAFRGHKESDGNFSQLLKRRREDIPDLEMCWRNTTNFTSPSAQTEIAEMFSHQILRTIISEIQQNEFYAATADGTQDVACQEQESFV